MIFSRQLRHGVWRQERRHGRRAYLRRKAFGFGGPVGAFNGMLFGLWEAREKGRLDVKTSLAYVVGGIVAGILLSAWEAHDTWEKNEREFTSRD